MTTKNSTPETSAAAETAEDVEAVRTTSPIVGLTWTGTATLGEASPGVRKIGYTARFRAVDLVATRANGTTEQRAEVMLRANHESDLIAAIVAAMADGTSAEDAERGILSSGTFSFGPTQRASRVKATSFAAKAVAAAAAKAAAAAAAE